MAIEQFVAPHLGVRTNHSTVFSHMTPEVPYSGKLSWDKTFAFLVNFQFRGENFREWGGVSTCGHVEPFNIATNHKDCRRMESYSIHTSVRGYHVYKDVWEAALGQPATLPERTW